MKKILDIPLIETAVPRNMWPRAVDKARAHKDLVGILLQVDCVRASIDEEASEISRKGQETWWERNYDNSWLRVMFDAIKDGQTDVVELFLALGLTVESCDEFGWTALQTAAERCEQVSLVKLLLEKYQVDQNKFPMRRSLLRKSLFDSPLCIAAQYGNTKVVELLLEHKADPCEGQPGGFGRALAAAAVGGPRGFGQPLVAG
ncbi:uncharacterized protein TrAtP1_001924 [Trichoderma atroviride]|uniref:uncharacterized protein n=1 Tax=Hypocrea atroviridis TaxID=63577 RepID=UPI0033239871|nr:hypothetical protein TrAtP1_001924 [Trichoderma atroviride]